MKKYKRTLTILITVFIVLLVGLTYIYAFPMKASARVNPENMEFDVGGYEKAEGFIDGNSLSDTNKLVAENDNFKLYLDETTTYFTVEDKNTGKTIQSNPTIADPAGAAGGVAERQKATIEYRYFNKDGTNSSRNNNYSKSISHPKTPAYSEGHRTYKIKELKNGFQVYYHISDLNIDHSYFPRYLTQEQVEPIIKDYDHPAYSAIFELGYEDVPNSDGLYPAKRYESMTGIVRDRLYKVFYIDKVFGEYTREDAIASNEKHGYFEESVKFGLEVAVQVTLNEHGFEIKVINDSIKEYSESKLSELTLYPFIGTAIDYDPATSIENEGYLVIPDGSGAVMQFNNGKTSARSYTKRLYGQDLASMPESMPNAEEDILLPVYGMVKEDIGYAAIITKGDAMATLNADISGKSLDSYNKIYPTFTVREREGVVIGSGWNSHRINVWSRQRAEFDFTIQYRVLTNDENNYYGIAKAYQDYLIEEKGLELKDNNAKNKLTVELLGAYDHRKFFLGVPYNSVDTLTNFKQTSEIIEELESLGVEDIDVIFNGIANGGLNNSLENKVKFSKGLGGKKGFKKLEAELEEKGHSVYPTTNIISTKEYNRLFDKNKYTSKRVRGSLSKVYEYHAPTKLPYDNTQYRHRGDHFAINPLYYETILAKQNKSYLFKNINFEGLGSELSSHYQKGKELYKQESLLLQEKVLANIGDQNVMINEPMGFAIPYLDKAVNVPINTTLYSILDYEIPLMQLVLNGVVEYTGNSINLASTRDVNYQFLKVLETGSGLKYTLSYENSLKLLDTDHNEYMSTEYINWLKDIEEQTRIIKENKIFEGTIIGHERLQQNVFRTTYSNGVEVLVNYNISAVNVDGQEILPVNYLIKGGK